jgi:hypothetical protein
MFVNKIIVFLLCGALITSCISETIPTVRPDPTSAPVQHQLTSTAYIGIPPISNPLIQAEDESMEEFVARIVARDISYSRPVMIILSQLKVRSTVLYGVPSNRQDVQQCWLYQTESNRECTSEDQEKYFKDRAIPAIFFAFVYSNSVESLFLVEHFYNGDEYYFTDSYRLVLELKDGKWVEKSILPVYW